MNCESWIKDIWKTEEYIETKKISFELLDSFVKKPPINILDIGCGLAYESEMFQKKYNSFLYLLDGDFESSKNAVRDRKYGSVETMAFYSKIDDLKKNFDERKLNYYFIDSNNLTVAENTVFDFVYSNVSCGFHYPLSTYADFLKKYTNNESIMIFDINSRYLKEQVQDLFDVVEIKNFPDQKKVIKCSLKFKK